MIRNFLTFDIEEWYYANFKSADLRKFYGTKTKLESSVDKIIEICYKYNIASTCFVVGKLAEKYPFLVRKLKNAGHEIASHSYSHKLIYTMTPDEFNNDLKKSCSILEDITGEKVTGFRAPSWSVNENIIEWFYDILHENGIEYSSSVYPAETYLFGIPDFPEKIHYPVINGIRKSVIEIPQSLIKLFGKKIGFSGGFFLRMFPSWFINYFIKRKNNSNNMIFIYLHPHDICLTEKDTNLNFKENLILKYGVKNCEKKLNLILKANKTTFIKMGEILKHIAQ